MDITVERSFIKRKTRVYESLPHIILFVVWVMNGGSMFSVLNRIALLLLLLFGIILLTGYNHPRIPSKYLWGYLLSVLFIVFSVGLVYLFSIKPQELDKYIYIILEFIIQGFFCVYIFSALTYEMFVTLFCKALQFIRWHALISAVFISFLPFLFTTKLSNSISGLDAKSFLYLFYVKSDQYSFSILGFNFTRNQGLFWEPGVLQFYLNLLLIFQLYIVKSKKISKFLTIFALITTYSTTAYIIMIVVMFSALVERVRKKPVSLIPILLISIGVFYPLFKSNVETKFQGDRQNSSMVRLYDFIQQLFVIKSNFFTGVGLDDIRYQVIRAKFGMSQYYQSILGYNDLERGSSNSILFLVAAMGVPLGGMWIYAYIKQGFILQKKGLVTFLLLVGVMVEPLLLKPFFVTFIMSGMIIIFIGSKKLNNSSMWRKDFSGVSPYTFKGKKKYSLPNTRVTLPTTN